MELVCDVIIITPHCDTPDQGGRDSENQWILNEEMNSHFLQTGNLGRVKGNH